LNKFPNILELSTKEKRCVSVQNNQQRNNRTIPTGDDLGGTCHSDNRRKTPHLVEGLIRVSKEGPCLGA
jgi:hypothetical protein